MKHISQSELVVMNVLWAEAPMGASELAEKVAPQGWNIRTIKTMLSRLVQKEILKTSEDGRRYLYSPCLSKEDYGLRVFEGVSQKFFKDDAAPLFLHLAKSQNLNAKDIDEIKALLDELKKDGETSS